MIHRNGITWAAIFVVMTVMFLRLPEMAARQDAVINTYGALVEVDALAKQKFVQRIDDERLVHGAIRGMLRQLDPYSGYIPPSHVRAFERRNRGEFFGVGIEIGMRHGRLTVIAPIEGSPAARAGVLPGDVILSINGREVDGLSVFDVEELLHSRGEPIRMRLQHEHSGEAVAITIQPGPVSIHTVQGWGQREGGEPNYMLDPKRRIGYIRVTNFLDNTMGDFDAALRALTRAGADGLILDLRSNPGGLMPQAIEMVDRFVRTGLILSTVTRRRAVKEYWATGPGTLDQIPLAVLINGASASAAEIVAGALKDHGRAVIVGERSFGKGSVQELIYLTDSNGAIKLTTAFYRLPNGQIIHRRRDSRDEDPWGVRPDITVSLPDAFRYDARGSGSPLPWRTEAVDRAAALTDDADGFPPELAVDTQLRRAWRVLCERLAE